MQVDKLARQPIIRHRFDQEPVRCYQYLRKCNVFRQSKIKNPAVRWPCSHVGMYPKGLENLLYNHPYVSHSVGSSQIYVLEHIDKDGVSSRFSQNITHLKVLRPFVSGHAETFTGCTTDLTLAKIFFLLRTLGILNQWRCLCR